VIDNTKAWFCVSFSPSISLL